MDGDAIPHEFDMLEECIFTKLKIAGDTHDMVVNRFLTLIGAHDGSAQIPSHLHNPVAKKMVWEYRRKFGTLNYKAGEVGLLTSDEVLRPITDSDKGAFHDFCLDLSH